MPLTLRVPAMALRTDGIAVVVVNYNTREHLRTCLASVLPEARGPVVVADNGSIDGSIEMVAQEFPSVVLDVDRSNPGYGAGANRGIRRCGDADVLLLNSDTVLTPGCIERLGSYLAANERAGVVGPRLVGRGGVLQPSCYPFPSPSMPLVRTHPLESITRFVPALKGLHLQTWAHDRARVVPWVLGAALLIRRKAFEEAGGFDESFFMYYEEIDLCYRLDQGGWETHFTPAAEIEHAGSASTSQIRTEMLVQYFASTHHYYRRRFSGLRLHYAEAMLRTMIRLRVIRDVIRRELAVSEPRRLELTENLEVWRTALRAMGAAGSD